MNKDWIKNKNRLSIEYAEGVKEFLEMAKSHVNSVGKVRCPCKKCMNMLCQSIQGVETHLFIYGIVESYSGWVYHGEPYKLLDPTIRRSNPHIHITDPADWEYLCNRWEDPEFKSKSKKAEKSRSHVKYNHVAGSHSFLTIREHRKKGDQFIGSIDLFKESHFKEETGWVNPDCEEAYNKMIQIRATAIADGLPYDELEITSRVLGMRGDMIKGLGKVPYEVRSIARGKRASSSSSSASMSSQRELQLQGQITELEKELSLTREELQKTRDESQENYSQLREMIEQFRR